MRVFNRLTMLTVASAIALSLASGAAYAQKGKSKACRGLPAHAQLRQALLNANATGGAGIHGGLGLNMWGTVVNRDGIVCAVAFSGGSRSDQWPGSRVISAAKAYTANAYSLPALAVSTANLYAVNQPGGNFWGLQFSNPTNVDPPKGAYQGPVKNFGQQNDPMVGKLIGGQIVFGGGFALYNSTGKLLGGLGVSGDTSCKDHNYGWQVRKLLGLDFVPNGPAAAFAGDPTRPDNIIYDIGLSEKALTSSVSSFGHVDCGLGESAIVLPPVP